MKKDDVTGQEALTTLNYDNYGNVSYYALPRNANNERLNYVIDYDNYVYTYPIRIENQFGEIQRYTYDYRRGKPVVTIDPAGEQTIIEYERLGRPMLVVAPKEMGCNLHKTITYEYHDIYSNLAEHYHDTLVHSWVLKKMYSCYDSQAVTESAIYSARGELLQKKKITEVNGSTEILTDGVHEQDALGRVVFSYYPHQ